MSLVLHSTMPKGKSSTRAAKAANEPEQSSKTEIRQRPDDKAWQAAKSWWKADEKNAWWKADEKTGWRDATSWKDDRSWRTWDDSKEEASEDLLQSAREWNDSREEASEDLLQSARE